MIDLTKLTPSHYSKRSRDYQLLARVQNAAYNNSKLSIDNMENLRSVGLDDKLTDLAAMTVGFEAHHQFTASALRNVYLNFRHMCMHKGTKYAIEEAVKILLRSQNLETDFGVYVTRKAADIDDSYKVVININYPSQSDVNIALIDDLLEYILPIGFVYEINRMGQENIKVYSDIVVHNEAKHSEHSEQELSTMNVTKADGDKLQQTDLGVNIQNVFGGELIKEA